MSEENKSEFVLNSDGSVEIPIQKDGLPSAVGVYPMINIKSSDRLLELDDLLNSYAMRGLYIDELKWIRNTAFDKRGEKTTLQIKLRRCKNKDEAMMIAGKVKRIIEGVNNVKRIDREG